MNLVKSLITSLTGMSLVALLILFSNPVEPLSIFLFFIGMIIIFAGPFYFLYLEPIRALQKR